jgi:protein TBF1
MAGLDMVKGPHWSQILTLFGQSGTISDILKDRTQVQLKDKARNLKLFFLKTNSEMPYYLQAVTGELKTRAPGQAARKEAEERARLTSEEDQAKLQGIMALSGMQHPAQNRSSASPAAGAGAGAVAHAQAAGHPAASGQQNGTQRLGMSAATAAALAGVQNRTGIQATNQQQNLQAVPQAPPRPQNQLPPQVPRPQPQPMPTAQHHAQQGTQQPAAAQHYAGNANTSYQSAQQPMTNRPPGPVQQHTTQQAANGATPSATTPMNSTQHPQAQQTHQQTSQSPSLVPKSEYPVPQESPVQSQDHGTLPSTNESVQQQDDNAAEAALLQGLQAAVASALSS